MNKPIPPLSPAAKAIMVAATNGNFNVVNDPVYKQCIAAAIRALADLAYEDYNGMKFLYVPEILAIAAELDGGAPQPTSTETPNG